MPIVKFNSSTNGVNQPDLSAPTSSRPELKPFNTGEFLENMLKGFITGTISTVMTFFGIDKPLAYASKAASENLSNPHKTIRWFIQQATKGNLSSCWNESLYGQAYHACWQHPIKGFSAALLNSYLKNGVFFPVKYGVEVTLNSIFPDTPTEKYPAFIAALATVYLTSPIAVVKARQMTDVPLNTLNIQRAMSGVNAIACRDSIQYGIFFAILGMLKEKFGDTPRAAGLAGLIGYIFSNPFSVIGLNQKTSEKPMNMLAMAKKIQKASGPKGFYPLIALSTSGMFFRGIAIDQGSKVFDKLKNLGEIEESYYRHKPK